MPQRSLRENPLLRLGPSACFLYPLFPLYGFYVFKQKQKLQDKKYDKIFQTDRMFASIIIRSIGNFINTLSIQIINLMLKTMLNQHNINFQGKNRLHHSHLSRVLY